MILKLVKLRQLKNKKGLESMQLITPEDAYVKTAQLFMADDDNKKDLELINQKINEAIENKNFVVDIDRYDFEDTSLDHLNNLAALLSGINYTTSIHIIPADGYYPTYYRLRIKWDHYRRNRDRKDNKQC